MPAPDKALKPIKYSHACSNSLSRCSRDEKKAALYEYAGAAFGTAGAVKLDKELTLKELRFVQKEFGELELEFGREAFLRRAAERFLERLPKTASCERFSFSVESSRPLGLMLFASSDGDCAHELAAAYSSFGFEEKVMTSPGRWVFFIQGCKAKRNSAIPAYASYFLSIARALGVDIYDLGFKDDEAVDRVFDVLRKRGDKPNVLFVGDFSLTVIRDVLFFGIK